MSAEKLAFLEAQVRRHKVSWSLLDCYRLLLACAEGNRSKEVAARAGVIERMLKDL